MLLYSQPIQIIFILFISNLTQYLAEHKPILPATSSALIQNEKTLDAVSAHINRLQERIIQLKATHESMLPKSAYLIISTSDNEVQLKKKKAVLRRGKCSSGSFVLLKAPEADGRQWFFKTPRGQFQVHMKLKDPSWYKPDWAYIEEGKPIPSIHSKERWQDDVLGKYAMSFGPAFMIHGTIYKRFLGLPATHGCIRLDDEDIQFIFKKLHHGNKIFIY
jgi:L,D-transpeptidase ErfK/SrfK